MRRRALGLSLACALVVFLGGVTLARLLAPPTDLLGGGGGGAPSTSPAAASTFPKAEVLDAWLAGGVTPGRLASSFLILRNTPATRRLVGEWLRLAQIYPLIDDSPSKLPNHSCFREHRHVEALLSLLLKFRFPADRMYVPHDLKENPHEVPSTSTQPVIIGHLNADGVTHRRDR